MEQTQTNEVQSVQNDIRTSTRIYKQTNIPTFNWVTPDSVLLASLARQLYACNIYITY